MNFEDARVAVLLALSRGGAMRFLKLARVTKVAHEQLERVVESLKRDGHVLSVYVLGVGMLLNLCGAPMVGSTTTHRCKRRDVKRVAERVRLLKESNRERARRTRA